MRRRLLSSALAATIAPLKRPAKPNLPTLACFEFHPDGSVIDRQLTKSQLMLESHLHARDVVLLDSGFSRRPRPSLLVRDKCILVAIAHIRCIIRYDRLLLLKADQEQVRTFSSRLASELRDVSSNEDFELRALDIVLNAVCEQLNRRTLLLTPLVAHVLANLTFTPAFDDSAQQLLPVKDTLSKFEIETTLMRNLFRDLLVNDEDMLAMRLSLRERNHGEMPPKDFHRDVELLLENYCSQLVDISQEAYYLRKRVEGAQSILELEIDSHRNRILTFNLFLTMGSLGVSSSAVLVGIFGMNLTNGLENSGMPAFAAVAALSLGAGAGIIRLLFTRFTRMQQSSRGEPRKLDSVFERLDEIEDAVAEANAVDKDVFVKVLKDMDVESDVADLVWAAAVVKR